VPTEREDLNDTPIDPDSNDCFAVICSGGEIVSTPRELGAECNVGGMQGDCDGAGECVPSMTGGAGAGDKDGAGAH
jgi:hypothetical protein